MGPVHKNPRKFRDKIALQNQLQDAKDKEFMAIMQEVSDVTRSTDNQVKECCEGRLQDSSCCLRNRDMNGYSQHHQGVGPMRHRAVEQRTSPYGRSRSLSPANVRPTTPVSNVPVILTQRQQTGNHLNIPAHYPIHRQKSDPNLYNSTFQGTQGYSQQQELPASLPADVNGWSYSTATIPQRRSTAGDIYNVNQSQTSTTRKMSEPTPPVIIVTDHGDEENSNSSIDFLKYPAGECNYRTQRSESPFDVVYQVPGLQCSPSPNSLEYQLTGPLGGSSPLYGTSPVQGMFPRILEENNQGLVSSFSNFQIGDFDPKLNQSCGQPIDPLGLPADPKIYCDLNTGYSDGNLDIDAMLASELEKYPNVNAITQSYLNIS